MLLTVGLIGHASATTADVLDAEVTVEGQTTLVSLTLSKGVTAEVFTLSEPYRLIVDLPDVGFQLAEDAGQSGAGLINAYRYGLFAERKARMVFDTVAPVAIRSATMTAQPQTGDILFRITLERMDATAFGQGTGAAREHASREATPKVPELPAVTKEPAGKPVVVIDPGHGGIDPGAIGRTNTAEKTVVLAVARQLQSVLAADGRYDVRMTRDKDIFISLDKRIKLSADANADLFVSLHADSIAEDWATASIKGATIYTLSDKASDEQARRMAEKENASDAIAGLAVMADEKDDSVRDILFDLMRRETASFSSDFSNLLVRSIGKVTSLSRIPQRSAAFKVLKQSRSPSVLVELGYLSNEGDERQLIEPAWQKRVAQSIGNAIDQYFTRRTAAGP